MKPSVLRPYLHRSAGAPLVFGRKPRAQRARRRGARAEREALSAILQHGMHPARASVAAQLSHMCMCMCRITLCYICCVKGTMLQLPSLALGLSSCLCRRPVLKANSLAPLDRGKALSDQLAQSRKVELVLD